MDWKAYQEWNNQTEKPREEIYKAPLNRANLFNTQFENEKKNREENEVDETFTLPLGLTL